MLKITKENIPSILARIEEAIYERRLSKKKFYEESGVSSSLYSQWNTGGKKPTLKSLSKIADYLGVSLEWLIDGKEDEKPEEPESNYPLREQMRDEMRILFDAAEDAPASAILEAAALIMRYKEQNE